MRDYKRPRRDGLSPEGRLRSFACGLALGLAVALAVYLNDHRSHGADTDAALASAQSSDKAAPTSSRVGASGTDSHGTSTAPAQHTGSTTAGPNGTAAPAASLVTRYDFYQMLPRSQVLVPGHETDARPAADAAVERPGVYFLQIGSYRDPAMADRVRLQVQKLGITANVQRILVDTAAWHRVRVGPIRDLTVLNHLRHQLQAGNLEALVVRVDP